MNSMEEFKKIPHFKAWLVLGIIVVVVATVLSIIAKDKAPEEMAQAPVEEQATTTQESTTVNPRQGTTGEHVQLGFSENFIDASNAEGLVTVDIMLNTQSTITDGAYLEVVYDPESLSEVDLIPAFDTSSLYGENADVTTLSHSPQDGKFVLGLSTSAAQEGAGRIASFSFKPLKSSSKSTTTVTFSQLSEGTSGDNTYPADLGSVEIKIK